MRFKDENIAKQKERNAKILSQDLFNSYACACDPDLKDSVGNMLSEAFRRMKLDMEAQPHIDLWVDGSYNPKTRSAGIGIVISKKGQPDTVFGKAVKAKDSLTAEIYALSIGISYILDTYPNADAIHIRYDCISSTVCATNIDAFAAFGAPYTNFRSALKRVKKRKISMLFEHTDAHADDVKNNNCDLVAKYYSKIKLQGYQAKQAKKLIANNKERRDAT